MTDHLTACLQSDEATLIAILKAAPFNHTYVQTLGPFTNGDLHFDVYNSGGVPGIVGGMVGAGNKVVVHTTT